MRFLFDLFWCRSFVIGLVCGAVLATFLWWKMDPHAWPSAELPDARRSAQAGRWDVVEGVANRYLRRFPEDCEAQILLARAEAARGDLAGCIRRLKEVPDSSPWSGEARLREAQAYLLSYQGARSEQSYKTSIKMCGLGRGNEQIANAARVGLAQIYALEVRYDEARQNLLDVLETTDNPVAVLAVLLEIEAIGPEPTHAIGELERFAEQDPQDFEARRALGHHYLMAGRLSDSRRTLEALLRERPEDLRAAESLAHCLMEQPDPDACRELLDSLRVAEERPWYWRMRGYLAERQQEWSEAAVNYRRAVKLAPHDAVGYHLLGTALNRVGAEDEAEVHLARAAEIRAARHQMLQLYSKLAATGAQVGGPGPDPSLCYLIGIACRTVGLVEAKTWFRESLARDPNHRPSRTALDEMESAENDPRAIGGDGAP